MKNYDRPIYLLSRIEKDMVWLTGKKTTYRQLQANLIKDIREVQSYLKGLNDDQEKEMSSIVADYKKIEVLNKKLEELLYDN